MPGSSPPPAPALDLDDATQVLDDPGLLWDWFAPLGRTVLRHDILLTLGVVVHNRFWIRLAALVAYLIAGLSIFNLLDPAIALLDGVSFHMGEARISLLRILKGALLMALLLWGAASLSRFINHKIH